MTLIKKKVIKNNEERSNILRQFSFLKLYFKVIPNTIDKTTRKIINKSNKSHLRFLNMRKPRQPVKHVRVFFQFDQGFFLLTQITQSVISDLTTKTRRFDEWLARNIKIYLLQDIRENDAELIGVLKNRKQMVKALFVVLRRYNIAKTALKSQYIYIFGERQKTVYDKSDSEELVVSIDHTDKREN